MRAKVEHPFRVIKRQFGYVKVRFLGLMKNTAKLTTLFTLSNPWLARKDNGYGRSCAFNTENRAKGLSKPAKSFAFQLSALRAVKFRFAAAIRQVDRSTPRYKSIRCTAVSLLFLSP